MSSIFPHHRSQQLIYTLCLLIFIGFSCSRAAISVGVIGLIAYGIIGFDFRATMAKYLSSPLYWLQSLFFLVILFSGINSNDKHFWWRDLQLKIPFVLMPLAFCAYNSLDRKFLSQILLAFASVMLVSGGIVMINYGLHYEAINNSILMGSSIPVPYSHIRYTLLLVFAFFSLLWLAERQFLGSRVLWYILAIIPFLIIHILSSRSGWLALYLGTIYYVGYMVITQRRHLLGAGLAALIIIAPISLFYLIPSFHNKINYMNYAYDQSQADAHIIQYNSDGLRTTSWHTGLIIVKDNFWTGTGVGDLEKVSKETTARFFPYITLAENRKMPHNQFIWIAAAAGIFGLIGYCIAFFYPLISEGRRQIWLFVVLYVIFVSSFISEYCLEEQIGSIFYLLFLMLLLATNDSKIDAV